MTIEETIYFEIILPKSSYLNYRLGRNTIIRPDETSIQAYDRACEEAEEWHKRKHPELYRHNEVPLSVEETEFVQTINACDTIEKLGRLKNQLSDKAKPYYMDRLKTLTNGFSNK